MCVCNFVAMKITPMVINIVQFYTENPIKTLDVYMISLTKVTHLEKETFSGEAKEDRMILL